MAFLSQIADHRHAQQQVLVYAASALPDFHNLIKPCHSEAEHGGGIWSTTTTSAVPRQPRNYSRSSFSCSARPTLSGRSKGNKITSRMVCELVSSMASRSTPTREPPAVGIP